MEVPFDINKYETERLRCKLKRFYELYAKYEDDMDEILEFAELWEQFISTKKYRE